MRLGGRLQAAIEILSDMEARRRPAADALKDWGLSHRFAGSGDRAAIGNIVYDALRRKRSAGWVLDADTPRAVAFGALVLEGGHTAETIEAALDGDRFAPLPLDVAERTALRSRDLADAPPAVRADCPDWCVPLLESRFGPDWVKEAAALAARPPLDMRVNTLKADRGRVLAELSGLDVSPTRLAPDGLRIPPVDGGKRHPNVQAEPAFQKGWFEVQDEGSQLAAAMAGARPGMQVLDFCAGAGGKTLALAAAMQNRGQIHAYDADKARLAPIFDRIRRAGLRNAQVTARVQELEPLRGTLDLVLVDAPCTGSGTWRRRPDAKWRLADRQLDARRREQKDILDRAAAFVKPGGRLAYVTCSIFGEENGDQIADFLASAPAFAPLDHAELWHEAAPGGAGMAIVATSGITMTPARTGTDGFFVSVLARSSS